MVVVLVRPDGARDMLTDRGARADAGGGELEPAWFAGAAVLHVTGYALADVPMRGAAREAARLVRAAGGRVAIDCAGVALIEQIGAPAFLERMAELEPDVVLGTSREVALLGGAPSLAPVVVEKRGAEGAVLHAGGVRTAVAAVPAAVVDTTGAGDALAGSLLGRLAQGRSPLDALRGAVVDAASCVGAPGRDARARMTVLADVAQLVERRLPKP